MLASKLMGRGVPLSLYVHFPWCVRKCPYCDFNSHVASQPVDQLEYVDAVLADLDNEKQLGTLPTLISIFIGGGTPSLMDGTAVERLLEGIARRWPLAAHVEVTLEANPGTVEAGRFRSYRQAGVNRLSLGMQSLNDAKLQKLERIHSAAEARRAYTVARDAGFDNINIDLMYGLPGQSVRQAMADLEAVVDLQPEHLSWYQLTLEPNTLFYLRPPPLPDNDLLGDMMEVGEALLAEVGYRRYEISAYARVGHECRHNLNYWQFGDYLGVGAGAHGKRTLDDGAVYRRSKLRQPAAYLAAIPNSVLSSQRQLGAQELPIEFFMNALRLVDGVPASIFSRRTGLPLDVVEDVLGVARSRGLMSHEPDVLRPTAFGLRFLDDLLTLFESDEEHM